MTHECARCHRVGTKRFWVGTDNFGPVAVCLARRACNARKLRYLKRNYPNWGK